MAPIRKAITKIRAEGYPFVIGVVFLASASVMLLVASLSTPVVRTSQIFSLGADVDGVARFVHFGIWGYCMQQSSEGQDPATTCSRRVLGWTIGSDVIDFLRVPSEGLQTAISGIETAMLVIYPLATVLSLLTAILSLFLYVSRRIKIETTLPTKGRFGYLRITFALTCFTAFTTFFVLLVHVELVSSVKKLVHTKTSSGGPALRVQWGNATWLAVSAIICLLGHTFVLRSIRIAKRRRDNQISQPKSLYNPSPEKPPTTAESHRMTPMSLH